MGHDNAPIDLVPVVPLQLNIFENVSLRIIHGVRNNEKSLRDFDVGFGVGDVAHGEAGSEHEHGRESEEHGPTHKMDSVDIVVEEVDHGAFESGNGSRTGGSQVGEAHVFASFGSRAI